jgi:DNA-binding LytR/AlgR family response regulator
MTSLKLPGDPSPLLVSDIQYLRAESQYTWFHLADGNRRLSSLHLGHYSRLLTGFIRIRSGVIVNPDYVASAERVGPAEGILLLVDNTPFPIAKRRITTTLTLLRERAVGALTEEVSSLTPVTT